MDNTENCFYQNVRFADTMVNGTWLLYGTPVKPFTATETSTKIVDLTGHGIASITDLFRYVKAHGENSVDIAFTVNPDTELVDYVYVTAAGWDAKYTFTLSSDLLAAGWKIVSPYDSTGKTYVNSFELNDNSAITQQGRAYTVTLYNADLAKAGITTSGTYYNMTLKRNNVAVSGTPIDASLINPAGTILATFTLDRFVQDNPNAIKTYNYEIGGLSLGTVTVAAGNGLKVYSGAETKNVVLGEKVTAQIQMANATEFTNNDASHSALDYTKHVWVYTLTTPPTIGYNKQFTGGVLSPDYLTVTVSFYPLHANTTYTVSGVSWDLIKK